MEDFPPFEPIHIELPTPPRHSLTQPGLPNLPVNAAGSPARAPRSPEAPGASGVTPLVNPPARLPAGSEPPVDRPLGIPPYLVSPVSPQAGEEGPPRMLTVVLRSSGDKTRDVLRLRRIHGIIMSYPGEDRFALQVFEQGRYFLLEFPNFTCGVCQDLLDRLAPLVGPDNMRVEIITFQ